MRCDVRAKKTTGLSDLFKEYAPQPLEEQKSIPPSQTDYPLLVQKYERYLHAITATQQIKDHTKYLKENGLTEILTPSEINSFLQTLIMYEDHIQFRFRTNTFINYLIQNSYEAGMNEFTLDYSILSTTDCAGALLHGTPERPLVMKIQGENGNDHAVEARYVDFTAIGKQGVAFSRYSAHCRFTLDQIWGNNTDWSWIRVGTIYARENIYQTSNKETADALKKRISYLKNCKIIFLDPEGNKQIIGES